MNSRDAEIMEDLRWWTSAPDAWPLWVWAIIAVVVLAAAAGLYFYLRHRRALAIAAAGGPRGPTPHEIAFAALAELQHLLDEDRAREFAVRASDILRAYIHGRFGWRAPHRSTPEFLLEVAQKPELPDDERALLDDVLTRCDMVKFAKRSLVIDQMTGLANAVRQFVEVTIPAAPAPNTVAPGPAKVKVKAKVGQPHVRKAA